jgi:NAD-dependent deacetylase
LKNDRAEFSDRLKKAENVLFFTGAGISAESGIPTFRGVGGIWNKLKPEELANFNAFLKNPDMVWEWYQYRRKIISESKPNAGHIAIAEMEKYFNEVVVVTQNIDNLHRRAGSTKIYELHGNIERNYCINCKTFYNSPDFELGDKAPRCKCGGLIRPDVVWFGEFLPEDQFSSSETAAEKCDICFVVGTSAVVYPAAQIPFLAHRHGAYLVDINLEWTELAHIADYSIQGQAGDILLQVLEKVKKQKSL